MKRIFLITLAILIIGFIVIQFFPREKNQGDIMQAHIINQDGIPSDIKTMLKTSCFDCHSNQTEYLWYDNIAPATWIVDHHIEEGKHHLNFSEWGKTDTLDRISMLDEISEVLEDKSMPLSSYTFLHTNAKLTRGERDNIINWSKSRTKKLLVEMQNRNN